MKWVLPRSLFGRMVLVLVVGLIAAQILSAAIVFREREQHVLQIRVTREAQRISDAVRVLEALNAQERGRVAQSLGSNSFSVLLEKSIVTPGDSDPNLNDTVHDFEAGLRSALGNQRPIKVQARYGLGASPSSAESGSTGPGQPRSDSAILPQEKRFQPLMVAAQIGLADGTVVNFRDQFPWEAGRWPFRLAFDLAVRLAAVVILSLIAVRWVTKPLSALATAAENLGENINSPPLSEIGPSEVSRAAHAFNKMQSRLANYLNDRARVLAAMSHDLKTPITRLRLRTEMLDDPDLRARFEKDLDEMESMVRTTLDSMRGIETGEKLQPIDVMALLESLQADYEETGHPVRIRGHTASTFLGKPRALKRCLNNLIENAVKYGKNATIVVQDEDARLLLQVEDEGPGIPPREQENVFAPFYRIENSRNRDTGGTGLGLSIARSIARDHGGDITCKNLETSGLQVTVTLPKRAAPKETGAHYA
ncbi:MAG TPA: ATP-binding protein [Burkholderiales bacterium]|nr:ATP-binding protein [Burkholderiales bacterium]